jgi:hypothetical protein
MTDQDKAAKDQQTTKDQVTGDQGTKEALEALRLRAEKAEKDLASIKDQERVAKEEAKKKQAEEETKKAIEQGKIKDILDKTQEELKKFKEEKAAMEKAISDRIEETIKTLPKEAQDEIALIKESLPLQKLDAFVLSKVKGVSKMSTQQDKTKGDAPPAPGVGTGSRESKKGHQIDPATKEILKQRFVKARVYDVAEHLGVDSVGKFGWGRSDNEAESTGAFIHLLDNMKALPVGSTQDDVAYQKVMGKKGD